MTAKQRELLITEHVRLVHHTVGRISAHLPENVDRDDLVGAGILGLIKAIDRYDAGRGAKLATYASLVIRGEIMETLRAKDWVPRSVRRNARDLAKATAELEYELGRPPSELEVAGALGVDIDGYHKILEETSAATLMSLEEVLTTGDDETHGEVADTNPSHDFGDPAIQYEQEDTKRVMMEAVGHLPEREKQVVGLYYQEELTLREIGEVLGVTESRVCQIHSQAMTRLRGMMALELDVAMPLAA